MQRRRKYVLRAGAALCVVLLFAMDSSWRAASPDLLALLQRLGLLLILVCMFGRTWCMLYIGGRKKRELITKGPYSVVRNPLYVFTIVGIAGIGLVMGSIVSALVLTILAIFVFHVVVTKEEAFLAEVFGGSFSAYAARVPRFVPRFSAWQDADELAVRPQLVLRTFFHASLFLVVVPLMDGRDLLRRSGVLPALFELP
jgi:protein-S-isoprenylcysteine O-methyltransferase Ste14